MPFPLDIWIVHPEQEACDAITKRFVGIGGVKVIKGVFEDLAPHDCFVTAGNSYGIMTAGIDAAVVRFHGKTLMENVQFRIQNEYLGEQPVGTAFIEETGNEFFPFVCHAPTMRVPGSIRGTDKVYVATFAALVSIYRHNAASPKRNIKTVAFPAMGTGFGFVSFDECARQMAVAHKNYLSPPHRLDWDAVVARHKALDYDGEKRVISGS